MRYALLLLSFVFFPVISAASTLVPTGDFTLRVSVSASDLDYVYSRERDYFSGDVLVENSYPEAEFAGYFFDSKRANPRDFEIVGSVLTVDTFNSLFTYDFSTRTGELEVFAEWGEAFFYFSDSSAQYRYVNDDVPVFLEEDAGWSKTTINISPIPLPAGFPLLVASLGALAVLRRRQATQ